MNLRRSACEVSKPQADEAGASAAPVNRARGVPPLDSALRWGGRDLLTPFRMKQGDTKYLSRGLTRQGLPQPLYPAPEDFILWTPLCDGVDVIYLRHSA